MISLNKQPTLAPIIICVTENITKKHNNKAQETQHLVMFVLITEHTTVNC